MGSFCAKCGAELSAGQRFCPRCGAAAERGAPAPAARCVYCNEELSPNTRFCAHCGAPVKEARPMTPPQEARPAPAARQPQQPHSSSRARMADPQPPRSSSRTGGPEPQPQRSSPRAGAPEPQPQRSSPHAGAPDPQPTTGRRPRAFTGLFVLIWAVLLALCILWIPSNLRSLGSAAPKGEEPPGAAVISAKPSEAEGTKTDGAEEDRSVPLIPGEGSTAEDAAAYAEADARLTDAPELEPEEVED